MKLHDYKQHGMVVMDGRRVVAKARPTPAGYLLTLYSGSWVAPAARLRNVLGVVDPSRMVLKRRSEVKAVLNDLIGVVARCE